MKPPNKFFASALLAATIALAGCMHRTVPLELIPSRPNILFLIADDHAPYVYGAYGNEKVHTPNLDRLAAQGLRFERAYCNSPVCTPSRAALITGRYPRTVGVTQLTTALPESEITLGDLFSSQGYDTAAIGKMHFNSALQHGFELRIDRPEWNQWLKDKGAAPIPEEIATLGPWRPFRDHARVWLNSEALPYASTEADMDSTFFADRAIEFLNEPRTRPFFLVVSLYQPHSPFNFPVEYRNRHNPGDFEVSEVAPQDAWQVPEIFKDLTREEKQGIVAAYYTAAEYMDAQMGRVLDALASGGHDDDTIVVFVGDHGYSLGQHGRFEKHCMFEPAVRSPLVMRLPREAGRRGKSEAMVEFIDIFPTLCDLANVPVPSGVQGMSLTPLLNGETREHRSRVIVEYSENEEGMIRGKRWKLIYGTGKRERNDGYKTADPTPGRYILLYDTRRDPEELHNVAEKRRQKKRVRRMLRELADHMIATARRSESVPADGDVYEILDACLQPDDVTHD